MPKIQITNGTSQAQGFSWRSRPNAGNPSHVEAPPGGTCVIECQEKEYLDQFIANEAAYGLRPAGAEDAGGLTYVWLDKGAPPPAAKKPE